MSNRCKPSELILLFHCFNINKSLQNVYKFIRSKNCLQQFTSDWKFTPTTNQPINKKKFKLFSFTTFKNLPYKMFKISSVLQKKVYIEFFMLIAEINSKLSHFIFISFTCIMMHTISFFNFFFIVTKTLHMYRKCFIITLIFPKKFVRQKT